MSVFTRIYEVVKLIPCGHVASYGQVAALAGNPRWSRVVGYALHVHPEPNSIPCFRVVTEDGPCVDMSRYAWRPDGAELLKIEQAVKRE